jgi:hypothetical protein
MAFNVNGFAASAIGKTNAAADTVYYGVIPGNPAGFAHIVGGQYTAGNTANSYTIMRPIGRSLVATAALSNVAVLTLATDPSPTGNTIAAGDQVVIGPATDGTYFRAQVNTSGWCSTTKVLTFTANLTAAVNTSAKVYMFGIASDTDPVTGVAFPVIGTVANTTTALPNEGGGFKTAQKGDPMMIYSPNATNATNLNYAAYGYTVD